MYGTEVPTEQQRGTPAAVRAGGAHAGVRAGAEDHAARGPQAPLLQQTAAAPEARYVPYLLLSRSLTTHDTTISPSP